MTGKGLTSWVDEGCKYALVGLQIKLETPPPVGEVVPRLWVFGEPQIALPSNWREWLGSIRAEQVEQCDLFFLTKAVSSKPSILDDENQRLQQHVWHAYVGLLLSSTFAPAHKPVLLTGARHNDALDIRQHHDLAPPVPGIIVPYPDVPPSAIRQAAQLGQQLGTFTVAPLSGGHWRFFRTLHIYTEARTIPDLLDRLHQYSRCIDGLILPDPGKTKQQFKSRTELFIGPRHHELMGEIYDVRSAVEHLHENRYLETFDRAMRLDLVKKEAIVEHIARTSLARIIAMPDLWLHFANTGELAKFWEMSPAERRRIWGDPIDPMVALTEFDPTYLHDGHLGGP